MAMQNDILLNIMVSDKGVEKVQIIAATERGQRKGLRLYKLILPKIKEMSLLISGETSKFTKGN